VGDGTSTVFQERLRALMSTLPIALYITELDAGLSGPRLLGPAIGGSLGFKSFSFLKNAVLWPSRIHPDDASAALKAAANARKTGVLSVRYRWRCADGTEKLFLDRGIVVAAPGGQSPNLIGVCLDITEQDKLKGLLEHYRELGFVASPMDNISPEDVMHDVNNLLTVIIWNLERSVWRMVGAPSLRAKWLALRTALTSVVNSRTNLETADRRSATAEKKTQTILLVEDDPDVRDATVARIEDMGHRIFEASSAKAALDILADGATVDLMLTDINMPGGMSGIDLADQALKLQPGMKLLFVSGRRPPREIERHLNGEVLMKPYRREELAAAMARAFAGVSATSAQREAQSQS
jgi:CheY-like chemotaxis protein